MAKLSVKDFSCLESAELELSDLTVLIGPQASGKSVLSKLIYFFYAVLTRQYLAIEDEQSIASFNSDTESEFKKWFPPAAWGDKRFVISFEAGPFSAKIARRISRKEPKSEVTVTFSDFFVKEYTSVLNQIEAGRDSMRKNARGEDFHRDFDVIYKIRNAARRRMAVALNDDYIEIQTFIPAGRSFFTNIGRAVTAFEQGGMLDPITMRFGRLFTAWRERGRDRFPHRRTVTRDTDATRHSLMRRLFGGHIRFERDKEYVESDDGRRIPFSVLSSGQQELLPLWLALDQATAFDSPRHLIYIEEPEAHLFPSAQDILVEYIASLVSGSKSERRILITTHSPYVLAKFNNLLKAGQISERATRSDISKLTSIIKRDSWLKPGKVSAYAIMGGRLINIVDDDGLIDGEYLDHISSRMGMEFSELLDLEVKIDS